jgi:hypothetical protein
VNRLLQQSSDRCALQFEDRFDYVWESDPPQGGAVPGVSRRDLPSGREGAARADGPEGPGSFERCEMDPVSFQGEWHVIAGTGRFDAAEGAGTYSGTSAGSVGNLLLSGSVDSPGAID